MPGPSYNNPQLQIERERQQIAADKARQNTEREKAVQDAKRKKEAARLNDQIDKNKESIDRLKATLINANKIKSTYQKDFLEVVRDSKDPSGPGGATQTPGELAAIAQADNLLKGQEKVVTTLNSQITDLENKNISLKQQLNQLYNIGANKNYSSSSGKVNASPQTPSPAGGAGGGTGGSGSRDGEAEPVKPSKTYKYNLPLIKPARLSSSATSPQRSSLRDNDGLAGTPGAMRDVNKYWKGETPGRGVLRVNRDWMKSVLNAEQSKLVGVKEGDKDPVSGSAVTALKPDPQLYGFRFQYNPEKIQMVYDVNSNLHPGVLASGKDVFLPLTQSSSAITVDLIFNRMEDMKYRGNPQLAIRNQAYYGTGENQVILPDIKEIHEKGTMYDMEYMFKTMNSPLGEFWSRYNGLTSDMGFIRPAILELHLGNRLRYPVRVAQMAIEHKIFDPRMVPIFSVVRITFHRFIEYETRRPSSSSTPFSRTAL